MPYIRTIAGNMVQFDSNHVPITRLYHPNQRTNGDLYLYVSQLNETRPYDNSFYIMRLIDQNGNVLQKHSLYQLGDNDVVTMIYEGDHSRAAPSVELSPRHRVDFDFGKAKRKAKKSPRKSAAKRKAKKSPRKSKRSYRK